MIFQISRLQNPFYQFFFSFFFLHPLDVCFCRHPSTNSPFILENATSRHQQTYHHRITTTTTTSITTISTISTKTTDDDVDFLPRSDMDKISAWTPWSMWTACSVSCGGGVRVRYRSCKGTICQGSSNDIQSCNKGRCPGKSMLIVRTVEYDERKEKKKIFLSFKIYSITGNRL